MVPAPWSPGLFIALDLLTEPLAKIGSGRIMKKRTTVMAAFSCWGQVVLRNHNYTIFVAQYAGKSNENIPPRDTT